MSTLGRKVGSAFSHVTSETNTALHSLVSKVVQDCKNLATGEKLASMGDIQALIDMLRHPNAIDDRKMLLEHILTIMAHMPSDWDIAKELQNLVVGFLYNDLEHPPATFVSNKFAWRTADGSMNNPADPDLGKSNTPYARSVQQVHPLPRSMLPDANLVFDTLLKREKFRKHPAGCSGLMFSFAALVIHTCFRTDHKDWNINQTTSYVDLSPLYGFNQDTQNEVRDLSDKSIGRGLLKPDSFSEDRLLLLPPAVCAILVLFNRNHNYIAKKLLDINERGTWQQDPSKITDDPKMTAKDKRSKQDEEIFQTARLINCYWFGNVVFSDYFATILGFTRQNINWVLDPFEDIRNLDHTFVERGRGNACSVEFNCLYRWHATLSQNDEAWITQVFQQMFNGKPIQEVTPQDFGRVAAQMENGLDTDVEHWTFGQIKRQPDGTFKDSDLARLIQTATSVPAGAFGARGTPEMMRINETMGIEQARNWGVCSLNDFRAYLGLKPYTSFEEWNPDPEVSAAASKLYYGDVNNLELYVGLQAEATKPVIDGAGLCPGYTISRAILADAIALTRGDRFFTTDLTPYNYTAWGFQDAQRDPSNLGNGSMLGRLLLRTLPNHYTSDSIYTWFPLMTPDAMSEFTAKTGTKEHYTFTPPAQAAPVTVVHKYEVVKGVLGEEPKFRPCYADRVGAVVKGQGFFIVYDQTEQGVKDQEVARSVLLSPAKSERDVQTLEKIADFFETTAEQILRKQSYFLRGKQTKYVDIADVLRALPVTWIAYQVAGLELKDNHPNAKYSAKELHDILGDLYEFIFLEPDAAKEYQLENRVKKETEELQAQLKANARPGMLAQLFEFIRGLFLGSKKNVPAFLEKLVASEPNKSTDEIANSVLSVAVGSTVELSQAMINMVNLYLDDKYASERQKITSLANSNDSKSEALLEGYAREALRIDPPFAGVYREATVTAKVADNNVGTGARLFLNIAKANRSENIFPNPDSVDPTRPSSLYLTGDGVSRCLGKDFYFKMMAQVLKVVFSQKNLSRAPGPAGTLKRYRADVAGTDYHEYFDTSYNPTPWASSLILSFDV